jgi:hypothetical protein
MTEEGGGRQTLLGKVNLVDVYSLSCRAFQVGAV